MAGRIPDAFIDDLLARSDIVDVIQSRVPLKKAGREYQARCPFHDERSPSFTVSPTKQFYHCFGCGAHGSAIKFLMEYDRLEFLDAVEELAKRAGIEVSRETRQQHRSGEFEELYAACDAAARFFQQQLVQSARAQKYLDGRGLSVDVRQRFGIGYAPDGWEGLKSALGSDARRLTVLDRVGLLSKNDSGRVYDKFRDRIIFPIHDRRGRVIAFGGRVIDKDDSPKYLNSPETPLFHKGRELYGLWQVRQAHARIERLVVVEGYMDVVSLAQYGVSNAVATLGTATTPDHAELLFRNSADVYFCFDGDRAGRGAAWKALESVLPRMRDGRQAFFLFLPEGEDPDSLVQRQGATGFQQQLEQAVPLSEFFFAEMRRDIQLNTLDGKARLAERCRPLLAQIPDGAFRDLMQQRLGELTGLASRPTLALAEQPTAPARAGKPHSIARRSLVRTAIALLIQRPRLAELIDRPVAFAGLSLPGSDLLLELVELCHARPSVTAAGLIEHFEGREEAAPLHKLALQDLLISEEMYETEFLGAIASLALQRRQQRLVELQGIPFGELSREQKVELVDLQRRLRGGASAES